MSNESPITVDLAALANDLGISTLTLKDRLAGLGLQYLASGILGDVSDGESLAILSKRARELLPSAEQLPGSGPGRRKVLYSVLRHPGLKSRLAG